MNKTKYDWVEAAKWYAEGMTQKEIAEKLGCKQPYVSQKLGQRREKKVEAPA